MIRSMTGYGSAGLEAEGLRASVTARSLNHRFLDVTLHMPRRLLPLEMEVRERVARTLVRGRVEIAVQVTSADGGGGTVVASRPVVASLVRALRDMQNEFGLEGGASVADLLRFPGALENVEVVRQLPDELRRELLGLVSRAVEELDVMRRSEGERLRQELSRALDVVEGSAARIEERSAGSREERCAALRERVRSLIDELGLDDGRVYQETVRAVERYDVSEEIQRLRSHVLAARELLCDQQVAPGKRLDFLAQELMREANTAGSKIQDSAAVQEVVRLKSEIERFREQVQNVE